MQDFGVKSLQVKSTGSWMDLPRQLEEQRSLTNRTAFPANVDLDLSDCQIRPREQAAIFLCLAQAVFLCHRFVSRSDSLCNLVQKKVSSASWALHTYLNVVRSMGLFFHPSICQ